MSRVKGVVSESICPRCPELDLIAAWSVLKDAIFSRMKDPSGTPSAVLDVPDRRNYTYLEALGRLHSGMAPWLESGDGDAPGHAELARTSVAAAVDRASPDLMKFFNGSQPVDAAFLTLGVRRIPNETEAGYPHHPAVIDLAKARKITADALLGVKAHKVERINDDSEARRMWKRFQKVAVLPERDQKAVIRLIHSLAGSATART